MTKISDTAKIRMQACMDEAQAAADHLQGEASAKAQDAMASIDGWLSSHTMHPARLEEAKRLLEKAITLLVKAEAKRMQIGTIKNCIDDVENY